MPFKTAEDVKYCVACGRAISSKYAPVDATPEQCDAGQQQPSLLPAEPDDSVELIIHRYCAECHVQNDCIEDLVGDGSAALPTLTQWLRMIGDAANTGISDGSGKIVFRVPEQRIISGWKLRCAQCDAIQPMYARVEMIGEERRGRPASELVLLDEEEWAGQMELLFEEEWAAGNVA